MNRRQVLMGLGSLGATRIAACSANFCFSQQRTTGNKSFRLPQSVAGVRIVDSRIARDATELAVNASPQHLFNHCLRTFVFGALVGKATNRKFDEELLYLACTLHDLGLTDSFMGDLPFEIQGAEAAKAFLSRAAVSEDRIAIVWDGIAMHPLAISQYKQPEIALVGEGAGADVLGPDSSQITQAQVNQVLAAFPRLGFKKEFVKSCADAIRRHPRTASRTFMRDIGERYVQDFKPRNFCDLIDKAPFTD